MGVEDRPGRRAAACKKGAPRGGEVARSSARGWQWQGRQLGGVVVVASQLLPQAGHQVAKLEHTNVSSKLQCSLSCYNCCCRAQPYSYLIHSLFEDRNIELYIPLEYALNIIHMEPCQSLKLWNAEFDSEITNRNTQLYNNISHGTVIPKTIHHFAAPPIGT
jgi:hypothetical protein